VTLLRAELDRELADRELCRRRLYPFVARMQSCFGDPFVDGWHVRQMTETAEHMERAVIAVDRKSKYLRNIVEMPPRHAKSHTYSKCLPLWLISRNPTKEVIVSGYGQDFISEFGDWVKNAIQSPAYRNVFPDVEWRKDSKAKNRMLTANGGGIRYVGAGSGITGRGAHWFIVDDPVKNAKEADSEIAPEDLWKWYWTVARTRLAPGGAMVVMHTRWRENDLIGRLLEKEAHKWNRLHFPAIATEDEYDGRTGELLRRKGEPLHPGRYTIEDLEDMKEGMPAREWLALYQQSPVAQEGNLFKREHLKRYKNGEAPPTKMLSMYVAADLATSEKTSADNSCIWPYGIDSESVHWFMPDVVHERIDTGKAAQLLVAKAIKYNALGIILEAGVIRNAIQPLLQMEMRRRHRWFEVISPPSTKDKVTRAKASIGLCEFGKMRFPDSRAFDLKQEPELLAFPLGKHDDAVDAVSIAGQCHTEDRVVIPLGLIPDEDEGELEDVYGEDDVFDDLIHAGRQPDGNPYAAPT
jgi:hypothetical protein